LKSAKEFPEIVLYRPFVDMRNQANGLASLVSEDMECDPYRDCLYVFTNKRRNLLKALYWDQSGFALWTKRLDQERFPWPKGLDEEIIFLSAKDLEFLLEGFDLWKIRRHKKLQFERFT